jgi:hypothetical protein
MEAKVESLENELADVRSSLTAVENVVKDLPGALIAMIERSSGKSLQVSEGSIQFQKGGSGNPSETLMDETREASSGKKVNSSSGDALSEFRHSVRKVELPSFDGKDPVGWISRAKVYFRVQDTPPEIKVSLAQLCMEGSTIHFFNSILDEELPLTWDSLKDALLERYGGIGEGDVYEQLTAVEEYIVSFEYLTAHIPKLPEKQFHGYFLNGLKDEIKGKVRSLAVVGGMTRAKLLQVASTIEREVKGDFGSGYSRGSRPSGYEFKSEGSGSGSGAGRTGNYDWVMVKGGQESGTHVGDRGGVGPRRDKPTQNENRRSGPRDRGLSHLTYQELLERKQKGICFKCKAPFHLNHQCPDKHLRVIIVEDGDVELEGSQILAVEVDEMEEEIGEEISIMSHMNLNVEARAKPQTMMLKGKIHEVPVLVLIDSGATHNFIDQKLVCRMGWEVDNESSMKIRLGDGFQTCTKGRCKDIEVVLGDFKVNCSPHSFELGGPDMVLGIEWLKTLGDTIVNWSKQTMSFWNNRKWVTLQGLVSSGETEEALQSIVRRRRSSSGGMLRSFEWKSKSMEVKPELTTNQQEELQTLLAHYKGVFSEVVGLPPN